jgi:hypothetical protein
MSRLSRGALVLDQLGHACRALASVPLIAGLLAEALIAGNDALQDVDLHSSKRACAIIIRANAIACRATSSASGKYCSLGSIADQDLRNGPSKNWGHDCPGFPISAILASVARGDISADAQAGRRLR